MEIQVVKCPSCGGEVQVDVSREFGFCSFCGAKIAITQDPPANATRAFANNREAALGEMGKIIEHFDQVKDHYRMIDSLNGNIDYYREKIRVNHPILYPVILLALWGVLSLLLRIALLEKDLGYIKYVSIFFVIAIVFTFFFYITQRKKINDSILDADYKIERIVEAIQEWYDEYPQCPIGVEYCHPDTLAILYDYLRKGRAETIKEALNLLANDQHNAEMKQIAIQTRNLTDLLYMNSVQ